MELILLWSCLNSIACAETGQAYIHYNPDIAEYGNNVKNKAEKYAGKVIISTAVPFVAAIAQNKAEIVLNSNYKFSFGASDIKLTFNKTF